MVGAAQMEVAGGRRVKVLAWLLFQVSVLGTWLRATHVPLLRRVLNFPRRVAASTHPPHKRMDALSAKCCCCCHHCRAYALPCLHKAWSARFLAHIILSYFILFQSNFPFIWVHCVY